MKTSLNLILGIAVLATMGGLATAATTVRGSKSNGSYREAASPKSITGKVSHVDPKAKTFTLTAKGKAYQFVCPKGGAQPKVGDIVDVTYTGTPGGSEPAQATTIKGSKSNSSY